MKSSNFLLVLNNPDVTLTEYLEKVNNQLKPKYLVGQLESGESGTPHFQMFIAFKNPIRCSKIKKMDNRLHIDIVKRNNGADDYCMKEDTRLEGPIEFGEKPIRRNNKQDW